MSHQDELSQWINVVSNRMPHLSRPEARVLALFSFGMVLSRSCALSAVALSLGAVLGASPNTVRQRLREFCYDAKDKRGSFRSETDVSLCFAPLLGWVLSLWPQRHLALALDATSLSGRFAVLVVSVLYNGCAIPVAWTVLPKWEPHAWKGEWLRLLRLLYRAVPSDVSVIVMADRGLFASWLFRRIVRLGWHPLLRINRQGSFRPEGKARFLPLLCFAPAPGTCWAGTGAAFATPEKRLSCTLLARFDPGHDGPWLLLTDLSPEASDALWYGMRSWIEQGFKATKRGGFGWQNTRMQDPKRAGRLWLCVAVATLWLLSLGTEAEEAALDWALPAEATVRKRHKTRLRLCGLFRQGLALFLACLVRHTPLPQGRFRPDPWPKADITTNHEPITYP